MNKKRTKPWLAFAGVFLVGLFIGAEYQHFVNGHHFIVHDTKSFPFPGGEVKLLDVSEYIGIPWFEGGSVLSLETKDGLPITVYKDKSNRIDEVSTEKNRIMWADVAATYQLTVEPIGESEDKVDQPATQRKAEDAPSD